MIDTWVPAGGGTFLFRQESTQRDDLRGMRRSGVKHLHSAFPPSPPFGAPIDGAGENFGTKILRLHFVSLRMTHLRCVDRRRRCCFAVQNDREGQAPPLQGCGARIDGGNISPPVILQSKMTAPSSEGAWSGANFGGIFHSSFFIIHCPKGRPLRDRRPRRCHFAPHFRQVFYCLLGPFWRICPISGAKIIRYAH